MAFKQKGFPKHKTVSHLKESEYVPQSQRVMNQYEPQTVMDWNDPRRKKLDHYVTEESTTEPTSSGDLLTTEVVDSVTTEPTGPVNTDNPSASSNRPTTNRFTEPDTSRIDARWARKNARREHRQAARQDRRDARQQRKMDRINNRTERREARRDRRANRKANRRGLGSRIRNLFSRGSKGTGGVGQGGAWGDIGWDYRSLR